MVGTSNLGSWNGQCRVVPQWAIHRDWLVQMNLSHFTMVFVGDISVINGIVSQLQMNKSHFTMVSRWYTIWLFNIAMENHHV